MKKVLLLILFFLPFFSQAQTIAGTDIVSLKTFTALLTDAIKTERLDEYFNPLGYKFSGMEDINRQGMPGKQLVYKGDHSDFKIDLINRLKLNVLYETPVADEYNYILTQVQTTPNYKTINETDSGLVTHLTLADNNYVFVFITKKTNTGMRYSISALSKVNNLVVNDDDNQ